MSSNSINHKFKFEKPIPVDEFIENALYEPNKGYYNTKIPFGKKGDFVTAPTISNLFSEIIAVWVISTWEKLGKPKKFNFVELGPGDGSLAKVLVETFKKFPNFNKAINIFLYEKSNFLIKIQKQKLKNYRVKWTKNFNQIKTGPIIFFGNEFFDAIPVKQFLYKDKSFMEKFYSISPNSKVKESYKKSDKRDTEKIKSFKTLKGLKFFEFPKMGLAEMDNIIKKIKNLSGGILLIDYGYIKSIKGSTLQAVKSNKKMDMKDLFKNIGKADITSLVNFTLLKEYYLKNNLKVKNIVSQKFFLEKMGIIERAKILEKKMTTKQKEYMYITLMRLLRRELMGELFKVIFAFKSEKNDFLGFK